MLKVTQHLAAILLRTIFVCAFCTPVAFAGTLATSQARTACVLARSSGDWFDVLSVAPFSDTTYAQPQALVACSDTEVRAARGGRVDIRLIVVPKLAQPATVQLVRALADDTRVDAQVCFTAQHRQMLDQVADFFALRADYDLDVMKPGQDLFDVTANVMLGLRSVLRDARPDVVCVHGDTTSCLAGALAAFYEQIPVAHVEAGLRTGDMAAPFPEEGNRALVGRIASHHFAPTMTARDNLLRENVDPNRIHVTGNTVIDALLWARDTVATRFTPQHWRQHFGDPLFSRITGGRKCVLITAHRRENFGDGFENICKAIALLAATHDDVDFVYPVHLNPNVREPVFRTLNRFDNIFLIEPQEYAPFVWLMDRCHLILTDSGGIQEEAPSLNKPVFVMRDVTERPEAVAAGTVRLVGTDLHRIVTEVEAVLDDQQCYQRMALARNPFGDGRASQKIVQALLQQR